MHDPIAEALGIRPNPNFKFDRPIGLNDFDRKEAIRRNKEMIICDRCGTRGNRPNMMRWHFENCTTVLRKCQACDEIMPRQGRKNFVYNQRFYCNRVCYTIGRTGKKRTKQCKPKIS